MEEKNLILTPCEGFDQFKLGMKISEVEQLLDLPYIKEEDEDGDVIISCDEIGFNFLNFDKEEEFRLDIMELNRNSNAIMWDTRIFDLSFEEIKSLCMANGYELEFEDELFDNDECIEQSYMVDSICLTFYFDKFKRLSEISITVCFNSEDEALWPN